MGALVGAGVGKDGATGELIDTTYHRKDLEYPFFRTASLHQNSDKISTKSIRFLWNITFLGITLFKFVENFNLQNSATFLLKLNENLQTLLSFLKILFELLENGAKDWQITEIWNGEKENYVDLEKV